MRALLGLAFTATLLLTAGCASTGGARIGDPRDILIAQQSAWNRGDIDAFVALGYQDSPALTFFSGGDITQGYSATLARFRKRYASIGKEMGRLSFTHLETVWSNDEAAVVRGRWALDFEKDPSLAGLFTLLLVHGPDGWRILHDHSSKEEAP